MTTIRMPSVYELESLAVRNALAGLNTDDAATNGLGEIRWTATGGPERPHPVACGVSLRMSGATAWRGHAIGLDGKPVTAAEWHKERVDAIADAEALAVKIRDAALVPDLVVPR